jgi:Tfp pilus assembly protein PilN
MIKINLIAERKPSKAPKAAASSIRLEEVGSGRNVLLVGILMIGVVAGGGWWWMLDSSTKEWNQKIADADAELKRLEDAIKKSEEFEAQKDLLARKIQLITDLKKQQDVPVHILDQISRNLPEFLWLESMTANKAKISVSGKATTYAAVSNFYSNLTDSGFFAEVELGRTFEIPEGVSFSMTCSFSSDVVTGEEQQG